MRRRWLIAAGIAVVVLGGALAVAVANLGRFLGAHRQQLAARVAREVGRPVEFDDLAVSLWGGPGVRIRGVRVVEDPAWGGGDLLRAEEVWVTVRLVPALVGRFEIRRVTLRWPVLTVIRDQRGLNLATLGRHATRKQPHAESAARRQRHSLALLVGLADVRDGEVRYLDRRREPPLELVVRQLAASVSEIAGDRPIGVRLRAAILGAEAVNLGATGSIGPFDDPPVPARTPLDLRWTLDDADAAALVHATPAFDVAVPRELIVAGPLTARGRLRGRLDELAIEAALDASAAAVRLGTAFKKAPDVALTAEVAGARAGDALAIRRGRVGLADASFDVAGAIHQGDPTTVDLGLDSTRAPLAAFASLTPAAGTADVGGTIEAHLTVQGALHAQPPPAVAGTIALANVRGRRQPDRVGLSELNTTVTIADGVARMPPSRFRVGAAAVEAGGDFRLGERVLTADGRATEVFGGTVQGRVRVELQDPKHPRFAVDGTARGMALAPLLGARESPLAAHVEGRLDADVSLAGAGARRRAVRRSLTGTARIDVHDGVLRGVKIVDEVLGAATGVDQAAHLIPARLRRKRPDLFGGADTRFDELRATARIVDRRATTDDLVMRTDSYTVAGRGSADFDGRIDLTATFVAGPALTADVLESVKDARWVTNAEHRIEVPFRVAGRFPDLRPKPDPAFVARAVGRALEARARKALRGDAKDDQRPGVLDDAIRRLQQLFGR
jgi:hypothetical protein